MAQKACSEAQLAADMAAFRSFNRNYTRFIGTLQEGLLDTEYSLSEARVLYELATRATPRAKEIANELGIDAGYLSRMLRRFEQAGLLNRKSAKEDNRYSELLLTAQGKAVFRKLDGRSNRQARSILESLNTAARTRLVAAMQAVEETAITAHASAAPTLRQHRPGDMGLVVHRESLAYAEEYGWDLSFEALAASIVSDFLLHFKPDRERCWIAEATGNHLGHVFLVQHPERAETAKLRLLFVEQAARGMGVGRMLVDECLAFAHAAGYRIVTLWTQSILQSAHRIYQGAGFKLVAEQPHRSFGKDLMGQTWERQLS